MATARAQLLRASTSPRGWRADLALSGLAGTLALAAYLRTMRPSFGWGDSSELTTAAYFLGVGHSPGYPTWMLIAYPFAHLPWGSVAWRVNFMTVVLGAVGVALLWWLCRVVSGSRAAALVGALAFAFSGTYWRLTTEAEVHTLHITLATLILLITLRWWRVQSPQRPAADRWLWLLGWLVGISLGNHALTALMIPALVYLVWVERGWRFVFSRRAAAAVAFALLGLCVYALPLIRGQSNPPPRVNNPHNLRELWRHMTAPGAREDMFRDPAWEALGRAGQRLAALGFEFTWAGVGLGLTGIAALARRDRRLLAALLLVAGLDVAYACNFGIFDIFAYYLPLHLVWACFIAAGAAAAVRAAQAAVAWGQPRLGIPVTSAVAAPVVVAVLLALPALLFAGHLGVVDARDDREAEQFARLVMRQVEPDAMVIGDWWAAGALSYLKYIEGVRPDVTISGGAAAPSRKSFLAFARRLRQPEFVQRYPAAYFVEIIPRRGGLLRDLGFVLVPEGPVSRLYTRPPSPESLLAPLAAAPMVRFGDQVALVRADLPTRETDGDDVLPLQLYWAPLADYSGEALEAMLMLQDGVGRRVWLEKALVGHGLYPFGRWRPGQVLREPRCLWLPEVPPGDYELLVRVREKGQSACLLPNRPHGQQDRDYRIGTVRVRGER